RRSQRQPRRGRLLRCDRGRPRDLGDRGGAGLPRRQADPRGVVTTPVAARAPLPRALVILLGLAAATITAGGMKAINDFLPRTILALILMITVYPIRTWLERKGVPTWLSALVTILTV